jgi:hypothetical protein
MRRDMKADVFREEEDGLWHIHCGDCALKRTPRVNWCVGKYSDRQAALSNAAAHMRSKHKKNGETW